MSRNRKLIAISIGDINGIGIELLIKCWEEKKINNFVLFTNYKLFKKYLSRNKYKFSINITNNLQNYFKYDSRVFNIYNIPSKTNIENTLKSVDYAFNACKNKFFIGLLTLPLRKDLINKKFKNNFLGHTEYLEKLDNGNISNMIFIHNNIKISILTTHLPLRKIIKYISKKNYINDKIITLKKSLENDFNIKNPTIAISGLNPHAGENGFIGTEEKSFIKPEINSLRKKGIKIYGPYSGDTMITKTNFNNFDCYVYFFHDQALPLFKYISDYNGVNYTSNLSILRASPDHGTAYEIVGTGKAKYNSILNCIKLLKKINKNKNVKTKKISKSKFSNR